LIPQVAFVCILVFFIKAGKTSVKEIVRLPKWYYFIIAILLQIGLLSLSELNVWFLKLLSGVGYEDNPVLIPSMDGAGFFGVMLVIAVFPSVLEELVFRGLLLKGLKPCGEVVAVFVCGALFALYHQKPEQTVYQFCCGAAFALVALKSGSVLPTVVAHFLNNAWILVMTKFSLTLDAIYLPFLIFSALCLVLSLSVLIFVDKKQVSEVYTKEKQNTKTAIKDFLFFAGIGISICGLSWILSFLSGL
jgi:membrane protease YdiL (CAAX protease family)